MGWKGKNINPANANPEGERKAPNGKYGAQGTARSDDQ